MLPKKNRVSTKTVEEIFKKGASLNSPSLVFKFTKTSNTNSPQISFIAPKNVAKIAVKRNFLRRRGYSALKEQIQNFPPGLVGIFIFKKYQDDVLILENEIKNMFNKIN